MKVLVEFSSHFSIHLILQFSVWDLCSYFLWLAYRKSDAKLANGKNSTRNGSWGETSEGTIVKTRSWWRLMYLRAEPPPVREQRILQGHVVKGSCAIVGRSSSREATILPSLVSIDTLVIEIWWFLFATWPCKTTWSKLCMTLWLGACQGISPF